jgi:hypothetical protein
MAGRKPLDHMSIIAPNLIASLALIFWPLVALWLYRLKPLVPATLWTILAGQLLLPVGTFFKFEMVPQFDKNSIPSLCALVGCMIVTGRPLPLWSKFGFTELVLCACLASPVITSLLNGDPIVVGGTVLPGVGVYDGLSALLSQSIGLIPFLLGRHFVRNIKDVYQILNVLAVSGLAYSVLLLFEIRFSPQLHFWFYGYYSSDFIQEMREGGGFRPMVFMGHGLVASFFAMTTVVACAALWRANSRVIGMKAGGLTVYLGVVLYLCKSGAALVYGLVLTPLVRWAAPKFQIRVAVFLVSLALLYPLMRITEIFPTQILVNVAATVNEPRAYSLQFRFNQEEELLQHALQRPWFGWGRFGRNRVYKEDWQGIGVDASITDGLWIITLGQYGIIGFLAAFSLLAIPIFRAARALRSAGVFPEALFPAALGLILAVNIIDLLPNSALSPWTLLLAGSLLGVSDTIFIQARKGTRQSDVALQPGKLRSSAV